MPLFLMSPLLKYGIMAGLIVAIFVATYMAGRSSKQKEWDASVAEQAMHAASSVIEQAQSTAKIETQFIHDQAATKTVIQQVDREVIKYVSKPNSTCELSPEFERAFDRLSQLLVVPSADGVPAPARPTGAALDPSHAQPTTIALLRVHRDATVQLRELWDAYHALVTWVRESYDLQRLGSGQPPLIAE